MNLLEAIVFILHYFLFLLTVLFFFLKFHKNEKTKFTIYLTGISWIIFATIDFFLALLRLISTFK